VERVFRIIELAIPKGNVVRQGRSIAIPVIFTNTTQALVNFFQFDVLYDPVTVHIDRVTNANTLTVAWPPLTLSPQNPGRIRIAGASGDPLSGSGPVAYLNLLALSGDGTGNSFGWKLSDLTLADPVVPEGVRVELQHGDVVTSGDCLVPLSAGERFALQPNRPNPFRDATTISFSVLPDDAGSRVSVDVYDAFGRHVRRLTDAVYPEGEHSLRFDASGLPEGVYFCRLTAAGGGEVRMLLKSR
jgi:hypothetical protein